MTVGQITIKELLRDPQFKQFFLKVPQLPEHYTPEMMPWRLFVVKQGESAWKSKRFGTYAEAFNGFKKLLPTLSDAAINCPGLNFMPPTRTVKLKGRTEVVRGKTVPVIRTLIWKPRLEMDMAAHSWCGYCRRPTIFVDKALSPRMIGDYRLPTSQVQHRCSICGSSASLMDIRRPENNQRWDLARPRIYS